MTGLTSEDEMCYKVGEKEKLNKGRSSKSRNLERSCKIFKLDNESSPKSNVLGKYCNCKMKSKHKDKFFSSNLNKVPNKAKVKKETPQKKRTIHMTVLSSDEEGPSVDDNSKKDELNQGNYMKSRTPHSVQITDDNSEYYQVKITKGS